MIYTYKDSLSPIDLVLSSGPHRPSKPTQAFILLTTNLVLSACVARTSSPERPLKPTEVFSWPKMLLYPRGCSSLPAQKVFHTHTGFNLFVTEGPHKGLVRKPWLSFS